MRAVLDGSRNQAAGKTYVRRKTRAVGSLTKQLSFSILAAAASSSLLCLVWLYGSGLRDARYLDGWLLAIGMGVQLYFHVARKTARLTPKSASRWRTFHIFLGYVLIAVFVSHCDFSLPDTAFEWALWVCFVAVALSGVIGTYLAWSQRFKARIDERISYDLIPTHRVRLARELHAALVASDPQPTEALDALPTPPHEEWIAELYRDRLRTFFIGPRNVAAHLAGSRRHLKRLTDEIDALALYVDAPASHKLAAMRALVIEKDALDFSHAHLGLTRAWLLVHVPITYSLIVLTLLHVAIVYAYSAGLW